MTHSIRGTARARPPNSGSIRSPRLPERDKSSLSKDRYEGSSRTRPDGDRSADVTRAQIVRPAYRLRIIGSIETVRDSITLEQIREELTRDPVARRAYAQVQKHHTEVVFDFESKPRSVLGEADWYLNRIVVYVAKHPNAKSAVGTFVHESSHIQRFSRGHINDLKDEICAHLREFLYIHGRRPRTWDRRLVESYVTRHYPHLE